MTKTFTAANNDPFTAKRMRQGWLDHMDQKAQKEIGATTIEITNLIMEAIKAKGLQPYVAESGDLAVDWGGNRHVIEVTFDEIL